jgi:hypothetical protein
MKISNGAREPSAPNSTPTSGSHPARWSTRKPRGSVATARFDVNALLTRWKHRSITVFGGVLPSVSGAGIDVSIRNSPASHNPRFGHRVLRLRLRTPVSFADKEARSECIKTAL